MPCDCLSDLLPLLSLRFLIRIHQAAANRTPPNDPAGKPTPKKKSPKTKAEIEELIEIPAKFLQADIKKYLKDNPQLPTWPKEKGSGDIGEWIDRLRLPAIRSSSPYPFLLLHNLGEESHDPLLAGRVSKLFSPDSTLRYSVPHLHFEINFLLIT